MNGLFLATLICYVLDDKNYLSLSQLNHIIKVHQYGYTEIDTKPSPINRGSTIASDFRIKMSGN